MENPIDLLGLPLDRALSYLKNFTGTVEVFETGSRETFSTHGLPLLEFALINEAEYRVVKHESSHSKKLHLIVTKKSRQGLKNSGKMKE